MVGKSIVEVETMGGSLLAWQEAWSVQASKQAERARVADGERPGDVAEFTGLLNRVAAGYLSGGLGRFTLNFSDIS